MNWKSVAASGRIGCVGRDPSDVGYQVHSTGWSNVRHEGLNRRVRLMVNRVYGFNSPEAPLALMMVTVDAINHGLPDEGPPVPTG